MVAIGCLFAFIIVVIAAQDISDQDREAFSLGILNAHNYYRELHDVPELSLSARLNEIADKRVKEWAAYQPKTLSDEYGANYSQLYLEDGPNLEPKIMVAAWYKNQKLYDYNKEPSSPETTNPFTQVVWKNTLEIGVGILIIDKIVNVVVVYSPAGNQPRQYMSNVTRPREVDTNDRHILDDILTL